MRTALITGITGQDGSHLAELLLAKGYRVCGLVRRSSTDHYPRLAGFRDRIELMPGDLLDASEPDEDFDRVWRDAVLNRVWSRLETYQATTPKNRYATVLQLRRDYPDDSIEDIAVRFSQDVGAIMSPEAFRKNLQRARAKYIELLIQELRETIHTTNNEDVEAEIFDLGLGYLYRRYTNPADH